MPSANRNSIARRSCDSDHRATPSHDGFVVSEFQIRGGGGGRGRGDTGDGGGGEAGSVRVMACGGGGTAAVLGGRLALMMAVAPGVEVRVGGLCGHSSPTVVESSGGDGGPTAGLW
jgi:hypothetical protein